MTKNEAEYGDQPPSDFGRKATSAVIWNTAFNLFRDILQFGTMLALVRMLPPSSYGELGLVTSIMGFIAVFSFNNFIAYTLQVEHDSETYYQDHFTAGAVLQWAMFLIANIIALILYYFPTYAQVSPFLHVLSLTFILEWPCELRRKMLERQFNWKRLRMLHAIGLLAGALLAIVMALLGAGTYALIVPGLLVTLPFIYDLFINVKWRPNWQWSWSNYRSAWRFGLPRMGSGLAASSRQVIESSVLTAVVGFTVLGIFNRSIGLAQLFCQKFAMQLLYAIYPVLTRISHTNGDPARISGLVIRVVAWIVVPISIIFAVLSEPVVRVIYGPGWGAVTPLLPWAMALGAIVAISHAVYMLLLAKNHPRLCMAADIALLFGTIIALSLSFQYGWVLEVLNSELLVGSESQLQQGIILQYLKYIVFVHSIVLLYVLIALRLQKGILVVSILEAILPPLIAGMISWFVTSTYIVDPYTGSEITVSTSVIWGASFMIIYISIIRLVFPRLLYEMVKYFPASQRICQILALRDPL